MNRGIYTLVLELALKRELCVGALGKILFQVGYYSYTGSARGSGGLKRIERHKGVIGGSNFCRRWHIDYLLPYTCLVKTVVSPTSQNLECQIAGRIGEELRIVPNFGSTDCRCPGHLHHSQDQSQMLKVVRRAHESCCKST